ncbi:MAG: UvrD-helicase domain-containing protein [Dissulfurispiraceae bacterium]
MLVYLKIILENDAIRESLSTRYRYVMVDEYQDTNSIQGDIACYLARNHGNIMVVGDDAQSIYGFRGGDSSKYNGIPG